MTAESTNAPFNWSKRDLACAAQVLAKQAKPSVPLLVLTDEEIVALDGLQHRQLAPTPWLDEQSFSKEDLGGIALRGLMARQMLAAYRVEGDDVLKLEASEDITGTLMLRRTSQTILRVEVQTSEATSWLFCYVHADGALLETIDPSGMHLFQVTPRDNVAADVFAIVNPYDVVGEDKAAWRGSSTELSDNEQVFAGTMLVSTLTSVHHDRSEGTNFVVYSGRSEVKVLRPEPDDMFTLQTVSADTLRRAVKEALEAPLW